MNSANEFSGRVAIVTGSSSGIGEAIARRLSDLGAAVVVNSARSAKAGQAVSSSLPGRSIFVQCDISDGSQVEHLLESTVEEFGQLDILVNNAGWTQPVAHDDLESLTNIVFRRTFEVNVFGTWQLTKAAIPLLQASEDGSVVTVTSIAGLRPTGSSIAYSMTKAALNHMTILLAKSFGPVRFNALAPGLVATPWTADWDDIHAEVAAKTPLGRVATPEDCAEAVLGLLRNRYVTGHVFAVDGGTTLVF